MKTLFANRNLIVSIFVVMLLIYGVQGMSYGQELVIEPSNETNSLVFYWAEGWEDSYIIRQMDLANGQSEDVIFSESLPRDIAIDASGGKIYWASGSRIQRANLDGTDIKTVVGGLDRPIGIDLDIPENKIYWADRRDYNIGRADLDGTNAQIVIGGLGSPVDVAIDVSGGKIYWADNIAYKIYWANLNGTDRQTVVTGNVFTLTDSHIAIDASGGKIYWTSQASQGKMQRADLDGANVQDVVTEGDPADIAIDASGGKIYWADWASDKIRRADLDGANVQDVVTEIPDDIVTFSLATILDKTTLNTASSPVLFPIEFSDINLARTVRIALGLPIGGGVDTLKIPKAELAKLTTLNASGKNIIDLTGLEHASQLTELTLQANDISDITPLAQLTQLETLSIWRNDISDITPLAQLTQLETLYLHENKISDIAPLAQLTQLETLSIPRNKISDITPLAQLTQLVSLNLSRNQISDVTPLAGLISLEWLRLRENPIETTYPLNALLDANPDVDLDVKITDVVPFPLPEATLRVLIPELQQQSMYWINTDTRKIESAGPFDAVTQDVQSLTVDPVDGKLYWAEHKSSGSVIKRANFDGTNVETLVSLSNVPRGIAVDSEGNNLYWTNSDLQIQTASLGGKDIRTVLQLEEEFVEKRVEDCDLAWFIIPFISCGKKTILINLTSPTDIAVNTGDGRLYWTELSGRLRRVNLDGTNVETLVSNLGNPYGITVADSKVYWAEEIDENSGKIQRANLNGTNIETLAEVQGIPLDLSVDTTAGKVYWANSLSGIQRTDINGGEVETVVLGITAPGDFVLVPDAQPITPTTATTDATVSISPASVASPAVGEQIEFSINISYGESVAGYQATVQFDTTALRFVESTNGDYLPDGAFFVKPKVGGNLVKLNAASLAGESNGDGTLATLTFEVVAVKASALTLSDVLLTDNEGIAYVPSVENAQITEPTGLKGDVNGDDIVNIQDLVLVAGRLGQSGANSADVNGDGIVNIQDLVLVAGTLGNSAAAPPLYAKDLSMLTAADVKQWLSQAQHLPLTDALSQRGVVFLEQLLTALIPKETALLANYPNPFNPETWIPYQLAKDAEVSLTIYAMNGQVVRRLALGHQPAGIYQNRSRAAYWDGRNAFGESVASGLYFYTLTAGDFSVTRKMLILK